MTSKIAGWPRAVARPGLPQARIPRLRRYYGMLRIPAARPAPSHSRLGRVQRCLRLAVPHACRFVRSCGLPGTGPPRFLGDPHARALLSDPDGTSAPGQCGASMLPSAFGTASAPAVSVLTGLNHTARAFAVYASQDGLLRHHARLASGCWPDFARRDWLPAGSQRKVSVCLTTSHPPSPGFPWRKPSEPIAEKTSVSPGHGGSYDDARLRIRALGAPVVAHRRRSRQRLTSAASAPQSPAGIDVAHDGPRPTPAAERRTDRAGGASLRSAILQNAWAWRGAR